MKPQKTSEDEGHDLFRRSFSTWKVASPWRRCAAQLIDVGLAAFCTTWAMVFCFTDHVGTVHWWMALVALTVYVSLMTQLLFLLAYHTTPGKKLMNLAIQSIHHKRGITNIQIFQRTFSWWVGVFSLGSTWTTIMSLPDRRGWHDLVSETIVVNRENFSNYPSPLQKKAATIWTCASLGFFVLLLMLTVILELRALRSGHTVISDEIQKSWSTEASWALLAGQDPASIKIPVMNSEKTLSDFFKLFYEARDMAPAKKAIFYKENMTLLEAALCGGNQELLKPCQSAQALSEMLKDGPIQTLHPGAFEAISLLEKSEAQNRLDDQLAVLESEIKKWAPGGFEFSALRMAQANQMMKAGNFRAAKDIFTSLSSVHDVNNPLAGSINNTLCEAEALTDSQFKTTPVCLQNPYWKSWSLGCSAKAEPTHYELPAEILGYWWTQAHVKNQKFADLSSWEKVKRRYGRSTASIGGGEATFEHYLISALDFVLNLKTTDPGDLVGLSKNLGTENPLWGWAQTEALSEFGEQWTFLIHPSEQNLIVRYNLLNKIDGSTIAGNKKGNSMTEASSNGAGFDSRRHSGGPRTQESR